MPVNAENGYTLTPASLEKVSADLGVNLKGVLLASPANPTGTVTSRAQLRALSEWCEAGRIALISDEIYHGLTFIGEETSVVEFTDNAVVINSFSKYYCMTGWRIGWMVLPEHLVRAFERLAQSLYISPPELSQIAAGAAFEGTGELEGVKRGYRANRDLLDRRLAAINLPLVSPMDGAFYAYVDVSAFTNDSMVFAKRMLAEINVAATPGLDFDPVDGLRRMRFSYAGSHQDMKTALDRMELWLK